MHEILFFFIVHLCASVRKERLFSHTHTHTAWELRVPRVHHGHGETLSPWTQPVYGYKVPFCQDFSKLWYLRSSCTLSHVLHIRTAPFLLTVTFSWKIMTWAGFTVFPRIVRTLQIDRTPNWTAEAAQTLVKYSMPSNWACSLIN